MKTGLKAMRVMLAGIPVVAGLCFLQGCSSTSGSTAAPAASVVPEPTQAVVKVETPAPKAIETPAVTVPVEKPKLKVVAPMTTAYSVKAGETISEIAAKYALRWQDVLAVNPSLKLNSHLRAGESVALPGHVDLSKTHAVPAAKKESPKEKKAATAKTAKGAAAKPAEAAAAPAAAAGAYVVKSGDSVSSIAAKHHVKRADLMKANNLTAESKLKVGQKLTIPGKGEAAAAEAPTSAATPAEGSAVMPPPAPVAAAPAAPAMPSAAAPAAPATPAVPAVGAVPAAPAAPAPGDQKVQSYTVKEGEDLYAVAIRWGVSPSELKSLNNLTSSDLQPGQILKIPVVQAATP